MPGRRYGPSALHINCNLDAILLIGGLTDLKINPEKGSQSAFLLVNTPYSGGQPWRWQTLTPMSDGRCGPGVLQLGPPEGSTRIQRVLVAGGYRDTAEILKVDCTGASDRGQWTQIEPLTRPFEGTLLVAMSARVLIFGELFGAFTNWASCQFYSYSHCVFTGDYREVEELQTSSTDDVQVRAL